MVVVGKEWSGGIIADMQVDCLASGFQRTHWYWQQYHTLSAIGHYQRQQSCNPLYYPGASTRGSMSQREKLLHVQSPTRRQSLFPRRRLVSVPHYSLFVKSPPTLAPRAWKDFHGASLACSNYGGAEEVCSILLRSFHLADD